MAKSKTITTKENIEEISNLRQYVFMQTLHIDGKTYAKWEVVEFDTITATQYYNYIMCYREYKEDCWCD